MTQEEKRLTVLAAEYGGRAQLLDARIVEGRQILEWAAEYLARNVPVTVSGLRDYGEDRERQALRNAIAETLEAW